MGGEEVEEEEVPDDVTEKKERQERHNRGQTHDQSCGAELSVCGGK
jgi:hypothetical protein